MTATSLWVEKHRRVPPPERKDPGGMAAADPRQASLPRVCRRPQQNCSHQPVPKQELIRTITASLEKLWAVKNVSLSWSPHACRRVWPLWRKKVNARVGERLCPWLSSNTYSDDSAFTSPQKRKSHLAHLAWSQCSSTSRFSAVLFGCTADCKACFFEAQKKHFLDKIWFSS